MARSFVLVVGIVVSFCLAAATAAADPIVTNGDFSTVLDKKDHKKTGSGAGWSWTNVDSEGWFWDSYGNPGGHFVLNDNGGDYTDPTLYQTVSGFTIGEEYALSWDYALHVNSNDSDNETSFGVYLDGTRVFTGETLSGKYWVPAWIGESYTFTATSTSHTFTFKGEVDGSDVSYRLDNVAIVSTSITPVPEPASLALVGMGALALGAGALRRRRRA